MAKHESLVEALAAFHTEAVKVVKDATARVTGEGKDGGRVSYTYGYADLATVADAVNPLLGKHGLAFISKPTSTENGFGLVYKLCHESGNGEEEGFWPLPDPLRVKPQDMGSWVTYWRRYALLAVTNTFPSGEDDDGAKASNRESWDNATPRTQHAFNQHRRGVGNEQGPGEKDWAKATDEEIGDLHKGIETRPISQAVNGYDWMASKGLHNRQISCPGYADGMITASRVLAIRLADEAMTPEVTLDYLSKAYTWAEARGLLKIQVWESETLDQVLTEASSRLRRAEEHAE
jgi:hypothetical protein